MTDGIAHVRTSVLRQTTLASILLLSACIGYGMLHYPRILREGGFASVALPLALLLFYAGAVVWGTYRPSYARSVALSDGTLVGLVIGLIFIADIAVENFITMNSQFSTLSTFSFMILIFLGFAGAGGRSAMHTGQVSLGVIASVWSALVSVLIALLFGFVVNFLFPRQLEQNLQASAEFVRSGIHDLATFTFYNTLDSASSHLLEAPLIATICGAIGSLIGKGISYLYERNSARRQA
jgi:hypothetical protein